MRLSESFERGVQCFPNNLAMVDGERTITYRDAEPEVHRIALALSNLGLPAGTKVGIYAPNSTEAFLCLIALSLAEYVWLPINWRNTVPVTVDLLDNFDCEILLYHDQFEAEAKEIRDKVATVRHAICINGKGALGPSLEDLGKSIQGRFVSPHPPSPDAVTSIMPSGGTTGRSKGIVVTNLILSTMHAAFHAHFDVAPGDRHLLAAPITHAAGAIGMMFPSKGGTNYMMAMVDPVAIFETIQNERITHLFLPPTALYALLAHPDVRKYDYSSLKHFFIAAAPSALEKIKEAHQVFGPVMSEVYGQAECAMIITAKAPRDYINEDGSLNEARLRSAGRPSLVARVELVDDDMNPVPRGTPGEIVARSHLVTPGYYKDPERSAELGVGGWHHTGDVGIMDEDGFITIVDRKKDMIISGGFNVYPNDVEQVLTQHEEVLDCAVIGLPDEKWGEIVTGVVQLKPGATLDEAGLIAFTKERIGSVQAPKRVIFTDDLPRSPNGKVLKTALRDRFREPAE